VRSRRRQAITIACLLAALAPAPPAAGQTFEGIPESRFVKQSERFVPEGGRPIDLQFAIARGAANQAARVVGTTKDAISMLTGWFGPFPKSPLTIVGADWLRTDPAMGATSGASVLVPLHWIAPVRDQVTERAIIRAIVRTYWIGSATEQVDSFTEALVEYAAMRAIHQQLEGSNFAAPRFFGGFVSFPLRSVLLSPPVADPRPRVWRFFDSSDGRVDREIGHRVRALQTIERFVGWPTMLQALSEVRAGGPSLSTVAGFADTLSRIRGTDLRVLINDCFGDTAFNYAVQSLTSRRLASDWVETTVEIRRFGSGRFTNEATGDHQPLMPVRLRFADGTELHDRFDGGLSSLSLVYTAKSDAVAVSVDPEMMLVLDFDRDDNSIVRNAPTSKLGVRLALHWLSWLQNAMLSYTALL
jgi:hypothetical protein